MLFQYSKREVVTKKGGKYLMDKPDTLQINYYKADQGIKPEEMYQI